MTPERWRQVTGVFHDALARDAGTREPFLDEVCAGDEALRAEVSALLEAHQNAGEFGESPIRALPHGAADLGTDLGSPDGRAVPWMGGPGMTLGSYRIERLLGRGGMGVVYLAYDTTLHRRVALKVVGSPGVGESAHTRLLREARNAAALNHPSICTIHEVGDANGSAFIAMEYVDGRPLSDRLRDCALSFQDAIHYAMQAADALAYAHDNGVVHRDFKAANVMVTAGGSLKIVDFGLARREDAMLADVTTMAPLAPAGVAVGTPYSMAPEQVRGGATDARTDIWALGVLLYEMVSSEKPFTAATTSELFSAILRDAPAPLPDATPVTLRSVIERCLEKDSGRRYQHTRDVRAALEAIQAGRVPTREASRAQVARRPSVAAAGVLALVTLLVAVIVVWQRPEPDPPAASPGRFTFSQLTSHPGAEWFPSLSPDGKWLVYSGQASGNRDIYLQSVGGQNPINLTADFREDDDQPAFSPDGERIAFRSSRQGGGIFVMGLTGEAPRRVTSAGFRPSWSPDGTAIAYSTENVDVNPQNDYGTSEVRVVDVNSGKARDLNVNDAVQASFSPDGRRLAVTVRYSDARQMDIVTVPLGGGEAMTVVVTGPAVDWNPIWSPDGRYLYYSSDRGGSMNLWRAPINLSSGQARGEPEPVTTPSTFAAHPSISSDGKLVTFSSVTNTTNVARLSIDPTSATVKGEPSDVTSGSRPWSSPDPSPDGQWVTFYSRQNPEGDLYIARTDGPSQRQLTSDAAIDRVPRWSPDGDRIAFFSNRSGPYAVWTIHADGSGLRQVPGTEEMAVYPTWSHDGSRMVTSDGTNAALPSLAKTVIFDPNRPLRDQAPEVLPPFPSTVGAFVPNSWSPDGQKLAGQISLTPQGIATYSLRSRTFDLLTDFGEFPVWLPDSRRLLFVAGGRDFFVLDTETRQSRKMYTATRGVLGPPRLTRDGRSAYFTRRMTESDIWLLKIE